MVVGPAESLGLSRYIAFTRQEWARLRAATPLTLTVPAGEPQTIIVNLYGYEAAVRTVTVQPGETQALEVTLTRLAGAGSPGEGGAPGTPTPPAGERPPTTREIWVEETPLPPYAVLAALVGAALLVRRR